MQELTKICLPNAIFVRWCVEAKQRLVGIRVSTRPLMTAVHYSSIESVQWTTLNRGTHIYELHEKLVRRCIYGRTYTWLYAYVCVYMYAMATSIHNHCKLVQTTHISMYVQLLHISMYVCLCVCVFNSAAHVANAHICKYHRGLIVIILLLSHFRCTINKMIVFCNHL